ncbi:hypothetical protein [Parachitinimonas caeni]|uniref:Uncharacterized protein n=1 Tax=Parachitinimonas caeni TaxID=3031301 RepID=A0ABT7DYB6_9NEIS|nr:hypothetical protein [Parachitinimonas caeni]MDK2125053.1 hypothetical protein [Parachitinimonas caeni]
MNFLKRHISPITMMDDSAEEHQKNVAFLWEQMGRVEEYPYALQITHEYSKSNLENHLVLYPDDTKGALDYLRLMAQSSWYMMRLHFQPKEIFSGHWLDKITTFKVRQGEKENRFDYHIWYYGVVAAIILRDEEMVRQMIHDHKILNLLESEDSPRDQVQFTAMFYEQVLYYLVIQYDKISAKHRKFCEEIQDMKLERLNNYAAILAEKYNIDQPCKPARFTKLLGSTRFHSKT